MNPQKPNYTDNPSRLNIFARKNIAPALKSHGPGEAPGKTYGNVYGEASKSSPGTCARIAAAGTAVAAPAEIPHHFQLQQSFPSPFSPTQQHGTILSYELPKPSYVELVIYDLSGRRVRSLPIVWQQAGRQQFRWDGRDAAGEFAASGVYHMCVNLTDVQGRRQAATQKIILLKCERSADILVRKTCGLESPRSFTAVEI